MQLEPEFFAECYMGSNQMECRGKDAAQLLRPGERTGCWAGASVGINNQILIQPRAVYQWKESLEFTFLKFIRISVNEFVFVFLWTAAV